MAQSIFISAAEPSADENAALLAGELRALRPSLRLRGVGGERMRAAGVSLFADTVTRSAMGAAAVGRAREVARLLARIAADFTRDKPNLVVCTDSWAMNVHVARLAHARGVPVLYYVAPQTWASRESRVKQMRRLVTRVACILPFEEPYFRSHGLDAVYVGHPLFDRVRPDLTAPPPISAQRPPVVAVLPGSRTGVTRANWPRLQAVMTRLRLEFPGIRFRVPLTANATPVIRPDTLPADVTARTDAVDELLPGCHLALCVSGTAALHVAAHGVPLIVVYHVNPLIWHGIARWFVRTNTYSLVNLLASPPSSSPSSFPSSAPVAGMSQGHAVAPEYIPWYGPTAPVADHAIRLLRDPARLAETRRRLLEVIAGISAPGASRRAAEQAIRLLK